MNDNDTKELFGYEYNFQSGFGNLNDAADSIGSLFGFGPEDRASVLAKADKITQTFFQGILNLANSGNYEQAILNLDAEILKNKNHAKNYKSSNSKAKHNKIATDLTNLKATLRKPTPLENAINTGKTTISGVQPNQASMGYIALGIMALYLFSKKGKAQVKRLY